MPDIFNDKINIIFSKQLINNLIKLPHYDTICKEFQNKLKEEHGINIEVSQYEYKISATVNAEPMTVKKMKTMHGGYVGGFYSVYKDIAIYFLEGSHSNEIGILERIDGLYKYENQNIRKIPPCDYIAIYSYAHFNSIAISAMATIYKNINNNSIITYDKLVKLLGNKIYSSEYIRSNGLLSLSININSIEIPILEKMNDGNYIFYEYNFDRYKDNIRNRYYKE